MPATRGHDPCLHCGQPTAIGVMQGTDCVASLCLPCFLAARGESVGLAALAPVASAPADGLEFGE